MGATEIRNFHMNTRKPVILLAPLDWGLGHTVRCIPIIKELLGLGCAVIVACNSEQKSFLRIEFPSLRFVELGGYDVSYGRTRWLTLLKLLWQIPKILTRIKQEKIWLDQFLASNKVDAVISDNRYGLFTTKAPCIFITHQLQVKTGLGKFADRLTQRSLYRLINRFTACWVPDWKEKDISAAGDLSHPAHFPDIPLFYIGCLSRFEYCPNESAPDNILVILSGPEPQRSILENVISSQLQDFHGMTTIVRGVNDSSSRPYAGKINAIDNASREHLNELICNARVIICRSGYTSVMDILKLGKKSILIPTPGQAEQEYLGNHLRNRNLACVARQEELNLIIELAKTEKISLQPMYSWMDEYKKYVQRLVESLTDEHLQSASADFGNSKK